jgi:hypothetical protein
VNADTLPSDFSALREEPYLGPETGEQLAALGALEELAARQALAVTALLPPYTGPVTGDQLASLGAAERAGLDRAAEAMAPAAGRHRVAAPLQDRPAARPPRRRARKRAVILAGGALLAAAACALPSGRHLAGGGLGWLAHFRAVRAAVYGVWLVPLAELALLMAGQAKARRGFRTAPGGFSVMILQVTTTGREMARVNEILQTIRDYRLTVPLEVWVVTEPGQGDSYPLADRVVTVPTEFTARAHKKARALVYSAGLRQRLGLDRRDVKILYNDDDVLPTKGYIEKAFAADYDICEGITAPRAFYGGFRPFGHFLSCHADDMRTRGCLIYCSVFQGLIGKPLHVHGEGLTVTGECERIVGWDRPVFASEDLTFGQNAAKIGMRWGWFCEFVELTSPWSFREFLVQRKRWFWGNVHAIGHRDVLPLSRALAVAAKWVFGVMTVTVSMTGLAMRLTGHLSPSSSLYGESKLAILTWLLIFGVCGWIDASSATHRRHDDSRLLNALAAVVMSPVSSLLSVVVIAVALYQGNPRTFETIRKTRTP